MIYIKSEHGKFGIQADRDNQWGFSLFDAHHEYPGGFGFDRNPFTWRAATPAQRIRESLAWVNEELQYEQT